MNDEVLEGKRNKAGTKTGNVTQEDCWWFVTVSAGQRLINVQIWITQRLKAHYIRPSDVLPVARRSPADQDLHVFPPAALFEQFL